MKKKILVIDDDQDILDLTEFLLKELGYKVTASLTADILDDLADIEFGPILLDDWLVETSGHEQCKILKTTEATEKSCEYSFRFDKPRKNCKRLSCRRFYRKAFRCRLYGRGYRESVAPSSKKHY